MHEAAGSAWLICWAGRGGEAQVAARQADRDHRAAEIKATLLVFCGARGCGDDADRRADLEYSGLLLGVENGCGL